MRKPRIVLVNPHDQARDAAFVTPFGPTPQAAPHQTAFTRTEPDGLQEMRLDEGDDDDDDDDDYDNNDEDEQEEDDETRDVRQRKMIYDTAKNANANKQLQDELWEGLKKARKNKQDK